MLNAITNLGCFAVASAGYTGARLTGQHALLDWLAQKAPARCAAGDVVSSNARTNLLLEFRIGREIANDSAAELSALAPVLAKVAWRVTSATVMTTDPPSTALVVVAQARHSFARDLFYPKVRKECAQRSGLAAWSAAKPMRNESDLAPLLATRARLVPPWRADKHWMTIPPTICTSRGTL